MGGDMEGQTYCLRWNNHKSNLVEILDALIQKECYVDCTIYVDHQAQFKAHRVVLAANSPYFQSILQNVPMDHCSILVPGVQEFEMRALIEYMYTGEVNVTESQIPRIMKIAEQLEVKGLFDMTDLKGKFERFGSGLSSAPEDINHSSSGNVVGNVGKECGSSSISGGHQYSNNNGGIGSKLSSQINNQHYHQHHQQLQQQQQHHHRLQHLSSPPPPPSSSSSVSASSIHHSHHQSSHEQQQHQQQQQSQHHRQPTSPIITTSSTNISSSVKSSSASPPYNYKLPYTNLLSQSLVPALSGRENSNSTTTTNTTNIPNNNNNNNNNNSSPINSGISIPCASSGGSSVGGIIGSNNDNERMLIPSSQSWSSMAAHLTSPLHTTGSAVTAPPSHLQNAAAAAMLSSVYESGSDMNPLKRKKISSITSMLQYKDTPILRNVLAQSNVADSSQSLIGGGNNGGNGCNTAGGNKSGGTGSSSGGGGNGLTTGGVPTMNDRSDRNSTHSNGTDYSDKKIKYEEPHSPYTDKSYEDDSMLDHHHHHLHSSQPYSHSESRIAAYVPQQQSQQSQKPEWKRYKQYTKSDILSAIDCVRNGMSALKAARQFGVPSRTLYDKVKKMGITTGRPMNRTLKRSPSSGCNPASFPFGISGTSSPYGSGVGGGHENNQYGNSGGVGGGVGGDSSLSDREMDHRDILPSQPSAAALLDARFLQQALEAGGAGGDISQRDALHAMAIAAAAHAAVNGMSTSPGTHGTAARSPSPSILKYMRPPSVSALVTNNSPTNNSLIESSPRLHLSHHHHQQQQQQQQHHHQHHQQQQQHHSVMAGTIQSSSSPRLSIPPVGLLASHLQQHHRRHSRHENNHNRSDDDDDDDDNNDVNDIRSGNGRVDNNDENDDEGQVEDLSMTKKSPSLTPPFRRSITPTINITEQQQKSSSSTITPPPPPPPSSTLLPSSSVSVAARSDSISPLLPHNQRATPSPTPPPPPPPPPQQQGVIVPPQTTKIISSFHSIEDSVLNMKREIVTTPDEDSSVHG